MSDNETIPPDTDDQLRARLQAFARDVEERADTEDALERLPRPSRLPTTGLMAIAAALLVVVGLAAVVASDRRGIDTIDTTDSSTTTTDCPSTTRPRIITLGGQMNKRFAIPVARVAAAILLFGACADADADADTETTVDDGSPRLLARGNVELWGNKGLGANKMDINAEEQDGKVTGQAEFNEIVVTFECMDDDAPDGVVILGGKLTKPSSDPPPNVGDWMAVIIREGKPDKVVVWFDDLDAGPPSASCAALLASIPDDLPMNESDLVPVEKGYDIETG